MEFSNHCLNTKLDVEEGGRGCSGRFNSQKDRQRKYRNSGDDTQYKSKNLTAERKRREKLSQRLLALRSLVPIITNMNKVSIIEDAVTYIKELQMNVKELSDQLMEMETSSAVEAIKSLKVETNPAEDMERVGIQPDVKVMRLDGKKLWTRILFEKRRGRVAKFMEAISAHGLELVDLSVTTSMAATLVTSSIQGSRGEVLESSSTGELLWEIVGHI